MKPESILQSNLLDILFENRNKDYGAYVLRKEYNHTLGKAVLSMAALVIVFAVLQVFKSPLVVQPVLPEIPGATTVSLPQLPKKLPPAHATVQSAIKEQTVPIIVKADSLLKKPEEPLLIKNSGPNDIPGTSVDVPGNTSGGGGGTGGAGKDSGTAIEPPKEKIVPDKTIPLDNADISPQYPGGIAQLLKFLKSNLHSPDEVEAEVQVKVRFVVNYDGTLARFDVTESGGDAFDKEVLRVLKKMPRWIPGKTNGDNVSVWFTVPVKFTPSE